jgi:site-specific DNA recombinase
MLQNRLYRGEVAHKDKIYPGQHEVIIEPELWEIVQKRLAASRRERSMAVGAEAPSLLSGLIFDSDGARHSPTHAVKKGSAIAIMSPVLLWRCSGARKGWSVIRQRPS